MADSTILNLDLQTTGANAGTWGSKTNDNLEKVENAIKGYTTVSVATSGTLALTTTSGGTGDQQSRASLKLTGSLSGNVDWNARPILIGTSFMTPPLVEDTRLHSDRQEGRHLRFLTLIPNTWFTQMELRCLMYSQT